MTATDPIPSPLHETLEDRIRHRAYDIWIERGRPDGDAWSHWFAAKEEILSFIASPSTPDHSVEPSQPPLPTLRTTVNARSADPEHRFHTPTAAADRRTHVAANEAPQRIRGRHFDNAPRHGEGRAKPKS
jgi:hypothetical protein